MKDAFFNDDGYRKYFFGFLIVVVFLIILLVFIFNKKTSYLIINESSIIAKKGSKISQLDYVNDKMFEDKYNVFSDGNVYEDVTIKNESLVWYYFDDNYKDLGLTKVSAAYSKEFGKIKVADYDVSYYDESDNDIIKGVIGDKDISEFKNSIIKSSYDLDGDGVVETVYTMNNLNLADSNGDYSYIFLVKNNELVNIIETDSKDSFLIQNIIDLNGDGKFEIIFSKGTNDVVTLDTCIKIYSVKKNKYLLNCE